MPSERQQRKIAWVIRVPLLAVSAYNVALGTWLKNAPILPIYLLVLSPDLMGNTMTHQGITSKLRDTYADLGVAFSVTSEKQGRILICAYSSNETTKSEKEHWFRGQEST
jgi:hypothetical protein